MSRKEERMQAAYNCSVPMTCSQEGAIDCFIQGVEWADKTMIDKACEWLKPVFKNYAGYNCGMDLLNDFRKAME